MESVVPSLSLGPSGLRLLGAVIRLGSGEQFFGVRVAVSFMNPHAGTC
jgi:hypothetical protein